MKRDRDLMRTLLLEVEASDDPTGYCFDGRFEAYVDGLIFLLHGKEARPELRSRDYQIIQMEKAGLIEFINQQRGPDFYGGRVRLTPAGHDAVEALGDQDVWSRLQAVAPREAYDILKSVISASGAAAIGAAFGWN